MAIRPPVQSTGKAPAEGGLRPSISPNGTARPSKPFFSASETRSCCQAPRPLGAPCRRRLEAPATRCDEHRDADSARQCAAVAKNKAQCASWPLPGLPFCSAHDPASIERRRIERQSVLTRLENVRKALRAASPALRTQALELLVLERVVTVVAVETVLRRYRVLG